ncbi:MAG: hypothetical protein H0T79_16110 [Deltaproteobacteria bacterium]|nr:hypothetical protein [Deltaproteobacteria bacterium]
MTLSLSLGAIALTGHRTAAYADDEEEDDGGGDGGGDGDPDADAGGEEEEEDKDQPAITAGGLFNIKTYPIRELFRPLTMTQGITQLRLGLGVDVSDKTAFEYFGVSLDARHGYKDNLTILGGFSGDYNFKSFAVSGGIEGSLAYDLVDIRLQARINRSAVVTKIDVDPVTGMGTFKPTEYGKGAGTQFSIDLGFPFRYVAKPEIAIVALETLISFDFNSIKRGNGGGTGGFAESCNATAPLMVDPMNCTEDGIKPDLAPSLGISTNPIAALSVVIFGQLQIRDFDTTNNFTIPATLRAQFSPSEKLDIGLEFKFLNMKPQDPDGEAGPAEAPAFYDSRFMNMYVQARY